MTDAVAETVATVASRIWARDASLWLPDAADAPAVDGVAGRLGWLDCIDWMLAESRADELQTWADAVITGDAFDRVIVLGMGGSSLAATVFASMFAHAGGLPVTVIDTTRPADITRLAPRDLRKCLFIVASKSGATVETADLHAFFRARLEAQLKNASAADIDAHFVFITDCDSALHRAAGRSRVFVNPSDLGGRFSALSYFGLAPAALAGVDLGRLLTRAQEFAAATRSDDPRENPALALGMQLGQSARAGRDKLILRLPHRWRAFGLWVEQLVAESTGKAGRGIVPVLAEEDDSVNTADPGRDDCIRARIVDCGVDRDDGGDSNSNSNDADTAAENIDIELRVDDDRQLGAEFFRWEFAVAVAAHYLQVNPFDQPDVAAAKAQTDAFLRAGPDAAIGGLPEDAAPGITTPTYRVGADWYDLLFAVAPGAAGCDAALDEERVNMALALFAAGLDAGSYIALLSYLPDNRATDAALVNFRHCITEYARVVATAGAGPRYLHSTGQLHKGGPASARFIQLVDYTFSGPGADDWARADLKIPGRDYTFGRLYRAQADADFAAIAAAGRPLLRVEIKPMRDEAFSAFVADFMLAMNAAAPLSPGRAAFEKAAASQ